MPFTKSARFELFYSPFCPTCPAAKEIVRQIAEEEEVGLEEINILSPDGQKRALNYGIKNVPFLVIDGMHQISGIPSKELILEIIRGKNG
jgi:small redox-active disulfide protein 1